MLISRCFQLVGSICVVLLFSPYALWGQTGNSPWERYTLAGKTAFQQGNYAEAEKQWLAALQEAEKFDAEDPRLAASRNYVAELYRVQLKFAEAEPLHKRALAILEEALGAEHPELAPHSAQIDPTSAQV